MNKNKSMHALQIAFILLLLAIPVIGVRSFRAKDNLNVSQNNRSVSVPPDVQDTTRWVKIFSDDFTSDTLDSKKWVTCYDWYDSSNAGCTNGGNDELEWYLKEQVSLQDGSVVLTAKAEPVTININNDTQRTYAYRSGMISTGRPTPDSQVLSSYTYGYYEAKIKFEGGKGIWPAFWLLPDDKKWPPEIDIMEFLGDNKNEILLNSHWANNNGDPVESLSRISGPDFTKDWHVYAINWQPGSIDWYIDGELKKQATGEQVPDKPMEIILNLAVGGRLPGNPDDTTPFPRKVQVDYINVYKMRVK